MRITFLTGGLEQGKDGVGDYARLLAEESARRGVSCQLIALADPHVSTPVALTDDSRRIETVRLPRQMPWTARRRMAHDAVAGLAPDWVSLQFVPYSFYRWGLAGSVVRGLPRLAGGAGVHVMLHEIWIGGASWRTRAISAGQRRCILRLCRPPNRVIHTSNETYRRMLADYGIEGRVLPLFGSIPTTSSASSGGSLPPVVRAACNGLSQHRQDWWVFVLFGTLHPIWPPEPLLSRLSCACEQAGKQMALVSVGALRAGESLWTAMEATYRSRIAMLRLGEQPASEISQLLQAADFGIATSPYALLGKSATVAAMVDHGLPFIVNRDDGPPLANVDTDARRSALTIRMDRDLSRRLVAARRVPPQWRLGEVADRWLADLVEAGA